MKLKSLLLGSAAMLVVSTPAFSADLLEEFNLGTCDSLGISGITAESDTDCLAISGEVTYEYIVGDYDNDSETFATFDEFDSLMVEEGTGGIQSSSTVEWWLQFVATASSDFGQAKAWIKFEGSETETSTSDVEIAQAAVSIGGDPLTLIFGKTDSVFNDGSDEPLNFLGLYHSEAVDTGVGFTSGSPITGGHVIQAVFDAGNGITLKAGLEGLGDLSATDNMTFVGTVELDQDWGSAHASLAYSDLLGNNGTQWDFHTGATLEMDMVTLVGALAADDSGWWNVLGSASVDLDMATLAFSAEATAANEFGAGASIGFDVNDDVTFNLGGRYFTDQDDGEEDWHGAAQVVFAVSDNLTATGEVGMLSTTVGGGQTVSYVAGALDWAPGGGFTAGVAAEANSLSAYKITTTAGKTFD